MPLPPPDATRARVRVILNPAAGSRPDIREILDRALAQRPATHCEIRLTETAGDAQRFAAEAAAQGAGLVIACGGDGTVMEVASGLRDTPTLLAIVPCGTANVLAKELGLPGDPAAALNLALDPAAPVRAIDMGSVDGRPFLLRVGIGYEAQYNLEVAREEKSRLGRWAYVAAAWRTLARLREVRYKITTDDGAVSVAHGITCMICNSTSVGISELRMAAGASVSDGKLDAIVLRDLRLAQVVRFLASLAHSLLPFLRHHPPPLEYYWQARTLTVECNHHQWVTCDGEPYKQAKRVTAEVIPQAVRVVVPPGREPEA